CGFFLQAEDGIRDWSVTGVQTCALPISSLPRWRHSVIITRPSEATLGCARCDRLRAPRSSPVPSVWIVPTWVVVPRSYSSWNCEIGRASCRERGERAGVDVSVEKEGEGV